jgi:hypothetical protein
MVERSSFFFSDQLWKLDIARLSILSLAFVDSTLSGVSSHLSIEKD